MGSCHLVIVKEKATIAIDEIPLQWLRAKGGVVWVDTLCTYFRIFVSSKLDLLVTPSFRTGNVTTVAYRDDVRIELMLSSVYMSYDAAALPNDLVEHVKRKRRRHG